MIMIKKQWIWAIWAIGMLSACSNEDNFPPETPQPGSETIELTVSAGDFVTDGVPHTRATDNGNETIFESGDRIGLIILKNDGADLVADNLPYKYDGTSWAFDAGNGEGKTAPYYDNGIENVTYIAYFPYSNNADNVTTLDVLKSKFTPKPDQRIEADYRASDLMVWTSGAASVPQKKLDIVLAHAYASVSLSPEVKYTLNDGNNTVLSFISPRVSDVCVTVGNDVCLPFQAEDGSFRYILPEGTSGSVRWFYTFDGKTYGSSREFDNGATANTRYVQQETMDRGEYGLDKTQAGDFYCKNASDQGYLVPGDIASLPSELQEACIGIVYWVGDIKDDNYTLLDSKFPNGTHGLVVSLWDMPAPDNTSSVTMTWTYGGYEFVSNWLAGAQWSDGNPRPDGFTSIQVTDKMQGYANTIALEKYNKYVESKSDDGYGPESNKRVKPVKGLDAFETAHPAPSNSSGWYWPSVYELKYVCWGQDNGQGTTGKNMLNTQIQKVSGSNVFGSDSYWSSTESSFYSYGAWYVYFSNGNVYYYGDKGYNAYRVRPLLAF